MAINMAMNLRHGHKHGHSNNSMAINMAMELRMAIKHGHRKRSMAMKDKLIRFTIDDDVKESFKEYCTDKDTTMSNVLIDYITTILSENADSLPAEIKNTAVYCPYCGKNING